MSHKSPMVVALKLAITGNIIATNMRHNAANYTVSSATDGTDSIDPAHDFRGSGIEAGGRIDLTGATTADVTVKDGTGVVLYNATVTSDTDIAPVPRGVTGPITVTTANVSGGDSTLTVYWWVKV